MSSAPPVSTSPTLPTEREIRRLLLSRKPEDAAKLQHWLDHPPPDAPEAVVSLLAHIARDATHGVRTSLSFLLRRISLKWLSAAFTLVPLFFLVRWAGWSNAAASVKVLLLLSAAGGIVESIIEVVFRARAANRAALLLARIGDTRAAQHLAKLWTPRPPTRREAAFNADVARELARLLTERNGDRYTVETEKALRDLVERAFPAGRLARTWRRLRRASDWSERDTDLLLAVVRHLSPSASERAARTTPRADEVLLRRIADQPPTGAHDTLLRDTTQVLLAGREQAP